MKMIRLVLLSAGALAGLVGSLSAAAKLVTFARTHGAYQAPAALGGTEYCVVVPGEVDPLKSDDAALKRVQFDDVYAALGKSLRARGYVATDREERAVVRIVVHWGRTRPQAAGRLVDGVVRSTPTAGFGFQNSTGASAGLPLERERETRTLTAEVLGYGEEYARLRSLSPVVTTEYQLQEVTDELDQDRYFVAVLAYDMPAWRQNGRKVLLWQTRLSVGADGTDFAALLPAMIETAARHFGGNTHGLDRRFVTVK